MAVEEEKIVTCPACGSDKCARGLVHSDQPEPEDRYKNKFYLLDINFIVLWPSISLKTRRQFEACTSCGLVWNRIETEELKKLLGERGIKEGKVPIRKPRILHYIAWVSVLVFVAMVLIYSGSQA